KIRIMLRATSNNTFDNADLTMKNYKQTDEKTGITHTLEQYLKKKQELQRTLSSIAKLNNKPQLDEFEQKEWISK
ncbi:hypothetical protein HDU98_005582, partial [Podochytrium sp. JEL0797]